MSLSYDLFQAVTNSDSQLILCQMTPPISLPPKPSPSSFATFGLAIVSMPYSLEGRRVGFVLCLRWFMEWRVSRVPSSKLDPSSLGSLQGGYPSSPIRRTSVLEILAKNVQVSNIQIAVDDGIFYNYLTHASRQGIKGVGRKDERKIATTGTNPMQITVRR